MRRVDISTGTDPGVTFAQYILHPRSPNAKSLCTAGVDRARAGRGTTSRGGGSGEWRNERRQSAQPTSASRLSHRSRAIRSCTP